MAVMAFAAIPACMSPVAPEAGPGPTSAESPAARRLDVLDFVVGNADSWPRRGDQGQHQVVDPSKREVCWVKYGNPRTFECWRWDDQWVYHRVDHGLDGRSEESYEFTDGRWLPRWLDEDGVWSLDVKTNRVRWFEADCRISETKSREQPYRLRAWFDGVRDAGPDLGVRDVLVLEYVPDPDSPTARTERFHFARGAGWFSWEIPQKVVRFDRFGGPARARGPACGE